MIANTAGLTVTAAAIAAGFSRPTLSGLLNSKSNLSRDMALGIEKESGLKMDMLMRIESS